MFDVRIILIATTIICIGIILYNLHYLKSAKKRLVDEKNRIHSDVIKLDEIYNLSPQEFERWCSILLSIMGYENIQNTPLGSDGGKDIICAKDGEPVYVECKRYKYEDDAQFVVDKATMQKLTGTMVGSNIKQGIILTTGKATEEALQFARELSDISIKVYDGAAIEAIYNEGKEQSTDTIFSFSS